MASLREIWARVSSLDPVDSTGTAISFGFINLGDVVIADGDNTIVTGVALKKVRVLGYSWGVRSAGGLVTWKDSTPTPRAEFDLAAQGGAVYTGGHFCPAFECATGKDLVINVPAGVRIKGHLTYAVL